MVRTRKSIKKTTKTSKYSNRRLPLSGNLYKKNKHKISLSKLLHLAFWGVAFLSVFFLVLYGLFSYNKTNAESINQDVVLKQLSKILVLPEAKVISVKRVSNAKDLATQDEFYQEANLENGDYIIIYKDMTLVFNYDKNLIKKIKD